MAKQTFTIGQVLTSAEMTQLQANDYNQTVSAKVASYVLVAADAGTRITMSNASATTVTVNTALFTAGDTLTITNIGAGVCTITAGTATVSTGGSLALAQYDSGTLYFTSTGVSIWNGANPGDITAVTAGTGISGGGTSGAVTVTNSMATEITAAGDIIVGTGSGTFDNLPIGTTAQVLTADTTVSPYKVKWATPAGGGGKVLQVIQTQFTTATTIATTTMTDTGITANITPSSASSKVLVMINAMVYNYRTTPSVGMQRKIVRGSTDVFDQGYDSYGRFLSYSGAIELFSQIWTVYLDSPATTSSTTYKMQANLSQTTSGNTMTWQRSSYPSVMILMEIGA